MDDSSACVTSTSERESTEAMCSSSSSASLGDHNAEDKLSTGLSSEFKISDGNRTNRIDDVREEEDEEEDNEDEDDLSEEALLSQMGYTKSEPKRIDEEEEEGEEDISDEAQMGDLKNEAPIATPTACLNLVSGLKGGREKEGMPHKECRVSWSPEVYDPPCTSDDHYTPGKKEKHRTEVKAKANAGKNRQKSEGSKGGGKSKDKKKSKKHGGKGSKYGEN